MPRNADAIVARGLTKRFRGVMALSNVDLDVAAGEVVAMLGENGAGKSTLLRILGTAVLADSGQALVAGSDVLVAAAEARSSIGFLLPDERSGYWRLTGRHNLEFFGALHGLTRRAAASQASELLDAVGLAEAADRRFGEYSSGMRLRLSLARALLGKPSVLLLDEPTRSIDPIARPRLHALIAAVIKERRAAALIATHDLDEATTLADRCIFLAGGRVASESVSWRDVSDLQRQLHAATR